MSKIFYKSNHCHRHISKMFYLLDCIRKFRRHESYCISDLHGKYELYQKLLNAIRFSEQDTMYICGDIIDKGENSIRLAKYLSSFPNIHCILGNHEYAFFSITIPFYRLRRMISMPCWKNCNPIFRGKIALWIGIWWIGSTDCRRTLKKMILFVFMPELR